MKKMMKMKRPMMDADEKPKGKSPAKPAKKLKRKKGGAKP